MKLHADMTINGRQYSKGDQVSWLMVYPFFFVHMAAFGGSGFFMAYTSDGPPVAFLYAHGGIAITVYLIFYLVIFGRDEVRWMFINAGLGLLGIYVEIDFILTLFGTTLADYPPHVHVIPFLYTYPFGYNCCHERHSTDQSEGRYVATATGPGGSDVPARHCRL